MKRAALERAAERYRMASEAVESLAKANSYNEFSTAWFNFLMAWKGIYTLLEQGAKDAPESKQWFAAKRKIREEDPLLEYLYQARNAEEHGLSRTWRSSTGEVLVKVTPGQNISHSKDPITGQFTVFDADTGEPLEMVQQTSAGPALVLIRNRNKEYGPPIGHLGEVVDITPTGVAAAGLVYMQSLLIEAESLGTQSE